MQQLNLEMWGKSTNFLKYIQVVLLICQYNDYYRLCF